MCESLNELRVLKETKTTTLSVSHQHSSAAACEGTAFLESASKYSVTGLILLTFGKSVVLLSRHDELKSKNPRNFCIYQGQKKKNTEVVPRLDERSTMMKGGAANLTRSIHRPSRAQSGNSIDPITICIPNLDLTPTKYCCRVEPLNNPGNIPSNLM